MFLRSELRRELIFGASELAGEVLTSPSADVSVNVSMVVDELTPFEVVLVLLRRLVMPSGRKCKEAERIGGDWIDVIDLLRLSASLLVEGCCSTMGDAN